MKKLTRTAAFAALSMLVAAEAFAQAATQDVNISATVAPYCTIAGSFAPSALTATVPVNSTGGVNTAAINVTGASPPTVVCNTAANLQASSVTGGVRNATAAPVGFTNIIDYTGVASLGSTSSSVDTATVAGATGTENGNTAATTGAYAGTLAITVTPQAPSSPLISGSYSDTLRVTITPQ
jgi:hypothetical protein